MSRLDEMLRFLEHDPTDSFARYAVALELRAQRRMREAIEQLEELRRREPSYLATYYQLGEILALEGDLDRADEAYRTGIDVALSAGDHHTQSELEAALDELDALR